MPVQTWTPGQVLTAAELKSVTDMLPYLATQSVSLNPCVAGTFYRCQPSGAITLTLPTPTAGAVIGFKLDAAAGNTVAIAHNASETLYGVDMETSVTRGVTSYTLQVPDDYIVLQADGTNWHEIAHGLLNGPAGILSGGYAQATANTTGITTEGSIGGLSVTVTVPPGRRIKITAYCPEVLSSVDGDLFEVRIKESATRLQAAEVNVGSAANGNAACAVWVGQPSAAVHTYNVTCVRVGGTGAGTFVASATSPAFILVEDIGGL